MSIKNIDYPQKYEKEQKKNRTFNDYKIYANV